MDDRKNYSRVNKYDKRRRTTKSLTIFMAIAIILTIILIAILIFGGKDKEKPEQDETLNSEKQENVEGEQHDEQGDEQKKDDAVTEDEEESEDREQEEQEVEENIQITEIPVEEIEDPNVIEAYTANWKPIGTTQEEPHETVFDQASDDWKEMVEAIGYALKLETEEMTIHWIGNGGEQQVNGYVQSLISDEHYTVYLQWQENEGWQPLKVERVERFIHPKQAPSEPNDSSAD